MRIKTLLKEMDISDVIYNHVVSNIESCSKNVKLNNVFVCIKGNRTDGHNYIDEAIANGARTIIYHADIEMINGINYIKVDDTKKALAKIANKFYRNITKKVKMIGVTGTNGKTTITTLLYSYLEYEGHKALLIGTSGIYFHHGHYETNNTTPDILLTLRVIKSAYQKGCRYVIMEVSSQAIQELRVYGFDYNIGVFSNLTPEHLDYHKNMTDYKYSKGLFFSSIKKGKGNFVVLNKDDLTYPLYSKITHASVYTYSIKKDSNYKAININKSLENGTSFKVVSKDRKTALKTFLLGDFNIYNILAVTAVIDRMGFEIATFQQFIKIYVRLQGRMETLKLGNRTFIIDYAHTPDGVLKVCQSIREYSDSKLIVVIGCGGNRDRDKRPEIGRIVTELADFVILTNDNPRNEVDYLIIEDILKGTVNNNYEVILDREQAIKRAIEISSPNEIIAVLGKGSETTQLINDIKYPFNDKEVIKRLMKRELDEQ